VTTDLILLAVLMGAVTYPSRAVPLLAPGVERLPPQALEYLRLVAPAVLAALAAVNTMVGTGPDGKPQLELGIAWVAVPACMVIVRWRHNLFLGLLAAVAIAAVGRAVGLG
jgi:branched-subunit amino acid transport protein